MFNTFGYFKEYYIGNKFIGLINDCAKDDREIGYDGRKIEICKSNVILANGKLIKEGQKVLTIIYPLCSK